MQLSFGLSRAIPDAVTTAYGARLIEPASLVPDRQDLKADSNEAHAALLSWLNSALDEACEYLRAVRLPQNSTVVKLVEDDKGTIVASTNGSHGYVYLAAWLHPEAS